MQFLHCFDLCTMHVKLSIASTASIVTLHHVISFYLYSFHTYVYYHGSMDMPSIIFIRGCRPESHVMQKKSIFGLPPHDTFPTIIPTLFPLYFFICDFFLGPPSPLLLDVTFWTPLISNIHDD
jgi:hypothetical protein